MPWTTGRPPEPARTVSGQPVGARRRRHHDCRSRESPGSVGPRGSRTDRRGTGGARHHPSASLHQRRVQCHRRGRRDRAGSRSTRPRSAGGIAGGVVHHSADRCTAPVPGADGCGRLARHLRWCPATRQHTGARACGSAPRVPRVDRRTGRRDRTRRPRRGADDGERRGRQDDDRGGGRDGTRSTRSRGPAQYDRSGRSHCRRRWRGRAALACDAHRSRGRNEGLQRRGARGVTDARCPRARSS